MASAEIGGWRGRLFSETRLLTLTGTGGVGKPRLALRLATEVLGAFPNGVWLIELAAVTTPSGVPRTVAAARWGQCSRSRPPPRSGGAWER